MPNDDVIEHLGEVLVKIIIINDLYNDLMLRKLYFKTIKL